MTALLYTEAPLYALFLAIALFATCYFGAWPLLRRALRGRRP